MVVVLIAAAGWAQITMTVMATAGPVAAAVAAAAAAAAVEVAGDPLHRTMHLGAMAAVLAVGSAEVNPVAVVVVAGGKGTPMVVRGAGPAADQEVDNMAGADGASVVRMIIEVVVTLRGIIHTAAMPRPHEIATETNPETSGQHRREMHQMAMVDRPSYNPS